MEENRIQVATTYTFTDHGNFGSGLPNQKISLELNESGMELGRDGSSSWIDYSQVAVVRLSRMSKGLYSDALYFCLLKLKDGSEILIPSHSPRGILKWDNQCKAYVDFLGALHAILMNEKGVRFECGGQPGRTYFYVGIGFFLLVLLLVMLSMGLPVGSGFSTFALVVKLLILAGLVFGMVRFVQGNILRDYDPANLPKKFLP